MRLRQLHGAHDTTDYLKLADGRTAMKNTDAVCGRPLPDDPLQPGGPDGAADRQIEAGSSRSILTKRQKNVIFFV